VAGLKRPEEKHVDNTPTLDDYKSQLSDIINHYKENVSPGHYINSIKLSQRSNMIVLEIEQNNESSVFLLTDEAEIYEQKPRNKELKTIVQLWLQTFRKSPIVMDAGVFYRKPILKAPFS